MSLLDEVSPNKFIEPCKMIKRMPEIVVWKKSKAFAYYSAYIRELCDSLAGGKTCANIPAPSSGSCLDEVIKFLDVIRIALEKFPPHDQGAQRYGNKAYREWYAWLSESVDDLLAPVVKTLLVDPRIELRFYILDSFGNNTRIDYGTGHEAAFMMFLTCLRRLHLTSKADDSAVIVHVFTRYMDTIRNVQKTYRMEPAGSQGFNSLDDYSFLPFLFGAAQMIHNPNEILCEPQSFLDEKNVNNYADTLLFYGAIRYILQEKTGLFAEHSNQLWNISVVPTWTKILKGLMKMYDAEVLSKFPVVQHFLFGRILSIDTNDTQQILSLTRPSE